MAREFKPPSCKNSHLPEDKYRYYISYMPLAVEQFDLNGYDLVLSSSSAVAKGVITGPDQLHICICHSPMRYAWDMQHEYLSEAGIDRGLKTFFVRKVLHDLRLWDYRTSAGVDHFIAISEHISRRIWKVYRREAEVIYPPVDVCSFIPGPTRGNYYLAVSRLVPYKKMDLIAEAFSHMPDKNLVLIGDGPEMKQIKVNSGDNVRVLGYQTSTEVIRYMQQAKALVFAALEDFGIVLVEAQACGTPVIAYGRGGALESLNGLEADRPTGVFFHQPGCFGFGGCSNAL
jgi:glycosyltransferase involved in cell wall biosynthesis